MQFAGRTRAVAGLALKLMPAAPFSTKSPTKVIVPFVAETALELLEAVSPGANRLVVPLTRNVPPVVVILNQPAVVDPVFPLPLLPEASAKRSPISIEPSCDGSLNRAAASSST